MDSLSVGVGLFRALGIDRYYRAGAAAVRDQELRVERLRDVADPSVRARAEIFGTVPGYLSGLRLSEAQDQQTERAAIARLAVELVARFRVPESIADAGGDALLKYIQRAKALEDRGEKIDDEVAAGIAAGVLGAGVEDEAGASSESESFEAVAARLDAIGESLDALAAEGADDDDEIGGDEDLTGFEADYSDLDYAGLPERYRGMEDTGTHVLTAVKGTVKGNIFTYRDREAAIRAERLRRDREARLAAPFEPARSGSVHMERLRDEAGNAVPPGLSVLSDVTGGFD